MLTLLYVFTVISSSHILSNKRELRESSRLMMFHNITTLEPFFT